MQRCVLSGAPANTRASRRGNTGGASVIPLAWAYRVSRWSFKFEFKCSMCSFFLYYLTGVCTEIMEVHIKGLNLFVDKGERRR